MPLFADDVIVKLERMGISESDAKADSAAATEVPDLRGQSVVFLGQLCMHTCKRNRVFGSEDLVVE